MKTISAIALALLLGGCAWTPHDVKIAPLTPPQASTIGEGTKVFFRFSDERDDATVGHRSVATVGAKISAPTLDAEIERNLRLGLTTKGYSIVSDQGAADATAVYRLRSFKFEIETGFWSGAQNAATVIAVDGMRAGRTYTNVYRSSSEERIMAVPGGDAIDQQMNAAISSTMNQAWSDGNLDLFLTGKAGN
ncbi:MAG TPA: YajG family lipoprotein [Rhizomicrobium sp.]|jgi:uncharacterized lipoprotein YajG